MSERAAEAVHDRSPSGRRRTRAMVTVAVFVLAAVGLSLLWNSIFGGFSVEASLFRVRDGTEERLRPGDRLFPGDGLFLEIRGSKPMHVYVLSEDATGRQFLLFPLDGLDLRNPLTPGRRHRLPGSVDGAPRYWEAVADHGESAVLVIASGEPLSRMEREIGNRTRAGPALAVEIEAERVARALRGTGDPAPASRPDGSGLRLSHISRLLTDDGSASVGMWVRLTRLRGAEPEP